MFITTSKCHGLVSRARDVDVAETDKEGKDIVSKDDIPKLPQRLEGQRKALYQQISV